MKPAELILNPDGSIYHLHLLPEEIANTIILVGDPHRVTLVSRHFDRIELKRESREFITHTGWIADTRITVISTGIGTDNIDIVLNELDALVNIDLVDRQVKSTLTSLLIVRIGTSGSIHPEINGNEIVISASGIGTDSLGEYYHSNKVNHPLLPSWAYIADRYPLDLTDFPIPFTEGITLTCPGFYGPQGRVLRLNPAYTIPIDRLHQEKINDFPITNLEMETAGIYLLASLLGHKAISLNAILANRLDGTFVAEPKKTIDNLIIHTLQWLTSKTV